MSNPNPNTSGLCKGRSGATEYRARLTREAFERNKEDCAKVIDGIIKKALANDPVCLKIFAQSFMTKAPQEIQMLVQNEGVNEETTRKLLDYYVSKGFSQHEAAKRLIEIEEVGKIVAASGG